MTEFDYTLYSDLATAVLPSHHPDTSPDIHWWRGLLALCDEQLQAAIEKEAQFAAIVPDVLLRRQSLEQALIDAWDDPAPFKALSDTYSALRVVFDIAPLALAYHSQHVSDLRRVRIRIDSAVSQIDLDNRKAQAQAEQLEHERLVYEQDLAERRDKERQRDTERQAQLTQERQAQEKQQAQVASYRDKLTAFLGGLSDEQ